MNRRNPPLPGNLGDRAVERRRSPGWEPGELRGQGAQGCCQAPDLRTDLCRAGSPAAQCHTHPPWLFLRWHGGACHSSGMHPSSLVDFSGPC